MEMIKNKNHISITNILPDIFDNNPQSGKFLL